MTGEHHAKTAPAVRPFCDRGLHGLCDFLGALGSTCTCDCHRDRQSHYGLVHQYRDGR